MANEDNPIKSLEPLIGDTPIAPAQGIAAIALSMALKYHDIGMIRDGALYQQYKIEGRNFSTLHLDVVFETAMQIEAYLLSASERIAKIIVDALVDGDESEKEGLETAPEPSDATA